MARKSDGTVYIDTLVDTKGFGKGMNTMKSQVGGLSGSFKKLGVAIATAFSVKALVDFGKKAIDLGSDLQEVQNVVDTVFTTMSEQVNDFAKNAAETAGLSETMAKRYTGTFGAMAKAFGFAESESFAISTALTQLAGDVASFYNITQDEAYTKLKSVFTGETESLKDLGVVMTQNALDAFAMAEGFGKTTREMTEQEKVALRYQFVMQQLSSASGDFMRTSDSWANQTRILKLNIESIMASFGQGLINFFTPVIKVINTLLSKIATLANSFKALSEMIMGTKSGGGGSGNAAAAALGEIGDGYSGVADGATDAADATKKAEREQRKYLSGLDEIRTFTSENKNADSSVGSIGGAIEGQPVDFGTVNTEGEKTSTIFDGLIEKAKELAEIFKDGFFEGLGDYQPRLDSIKESFESIKNSVVDIFTDPEVQSAASGFLNTFTYALGQITGAVASIGLTIGTNIVGGLAKYLEQNTSRIKQYFVNMFNVGSEISASVGNLFSALGYIFEAFASETAQQMTADIIDIFAEVGMAISEIQGKFISDIVSTIAQPIIDSKEQIKVALEDLIAGFQTTTDSLSTIFSDIRNFLNQIYDEVIAPIFDNIKANLTSLLQDSIVPFMSQAGEMFGAIGEALKSLWEGMLKPLIQWLIDNILPIIIPIFNTVVNQAKNAVSTFINILSGLMQILTGLIDFITGVFTGNWEKAWNGIKNIFSGIINSISSMIESFINGAINAINGLIGKANAVTGIVGIPSIPTIDNISIPKLATGAVIPPNAPFMAVLGDQRHGNNLEMPEDLLRKVVREETSGSGNGGRYQFTAQINRRTLFDEMIEEAKFRQVINGNNPFDLARG